MAMASAAGADAPHPVPAQAGIGLRAPHHREFLERRPEIPWVEVHSENFFADGGRQLEILEAVRQTHGVSLHGVGLSIGSADALDAGHLRCLKRLVDRIQPALVSEHLSWSSVDGIYTNDLLPMPHTREALAHFSARVSEVQDRLGRQILVENVSSYLRFPDDTMTEWQFLAELARHSGCGILLDVNNVYVSARNHGFDADAYIAAIPVALIQEIHLAGHTVVSDESGELLIDTHDAPVTDPVWDLYQRTVARTGLLPTLIEWDSQLPTLDRLVAEARRADAVAGARHARVA
ncbi:MAG: DUF692 domain-containing protein [Gammaproteobacteria bacterium]